MRKMMKTAKATYSFEKTRKSFLLPLPKNELVGLAPIFSNTSIDFQWN